MKAQHHLVLISAALLLSMAGTVRAADLLPPTKLRPTDMPADKLPVGSPTGELPACDPSLCVAHPSMPFRARIVAMFDEPADRTQNWQPHICACDAGQFAECDPDLTPGQKSDATRGPCQNSTKPLFEPLEVRFTLTRDPDSYYCTIIGGMRKCYRK